MDAALAVKEPSSGMHRDPNPRRQGATGGGGGGG